MPHETAPTGHSFWRTMKATWCVLGFIVHAFLGTVASGVLMMAMMGSRHGGYSVVLIAPLIGVGCGLVGIRAGLLIYRRRHVAASAVSMSVPILIGLAMLAFKS